MNLKIQITIAMTLLISFSAYGHGEDKPGPHGGKIQMPGAFHTEVLTYKNQGFKIFLLDLSFENPTSADSKVNAKVKSKGKMIPLKCSAHPDHFYCERLTGNVENDEELYFLADRKFQKGIEVKYQLPLERR